MLGKPPLSDVVIVKALLDAYDLEVAQLDFLPKGADSRAWVFRAVSTAGAPWFVKLHRSPVAPAGLEIPRYLAAIGIGECVAPIATREGDLRIELRGFVLTVYPFIGRSSGQREDITNSKWVAYGTFLRMLHSTSLAIELAALVPHEAFRPDFLETVRRFLTESPPLHTDSPARVGLARYWQARRDVIASILERTELLAGQLAGEHLEPVLCHGDIHPANVLIDEDGQLRVVDWDGVALAPRERDLMFVIGGVAVEPHVDSHQQARFLQGYGVVDLDPIALAYYRHAWAVQEIGAFAEETLLRRGTDEATRTRSAELFRRLFSAEGVVDSADDSWKW